MAMTDIQGQVVAQTVLAVMNEAGVAQALIGSEVDGNAIVGRGKTLRVAKTEAVSVEDYDGTTPLSPTAVSPGYVDLVLDKAKSTSISIDDVDSALASVEVFAPFAQEAGRAIVGAIDADIIGALVDDAGTPLGPVTIDETYSAYRLLVDAGVELDGANVPMDGRWAIVSPAFAAQLVLDPRLNRATGAGDTVAASGFVGEAAGFRIVKSNRIDGGTVLCGHPAAAAFAQAVANSETVRSGDFFATVLRNLAVYGVKVLRPECLVATTWTTGS